MTVRNSIIRQPVKFIYTRSVYRQHCRRFKLVSRPVHHDLYTRLKSVILRVSEARDLGEFDRYAFYDHMKAYTAAPPDVLRIDEKNLREHSILNCCGVIITTNHKTDGIYLPADDRRHYVAWSECKKEEFDQDYWNKMWRWYEHGGIGHVAAYLSELDISDFYAKAAPPQTAAWLDIVDANAAPEEAELADVLD